MRTGKWRDAGIACAVVLAWHVMLGWILLRQFRFEPSPAADAAIRVVFLEPRAAPPMPRASTPGPHAPATVRRTPPVAGATLQRIDESSVANLPGFVRVVGPRTLRFPDYPGNSMFQTLGNFEVDPRAGVVL